MDTNTECLTDNGWKSVNELKLTDKLYGFDGLFKEIYKINKFPYFGDLFVAKGKFINFMLTPDHRCVVAKRRSFGVSPIIEIIPAKKLNANMFIPVASKYNVSIRKIPDNIIPVLGWILAEGSYNSSGGISIYQSYTANADKCEMIESDLRLANIDFKVSTRLRKDNYSPNSIERCYYLKKKDVAYLRSLIPNKVLTPQLILDLCSNQAEILINRLCLGDGTISSGHFYYTQKGKQNIDLFQMLCCIAGIRCIVNKRQTSETQYDANISLKKWVGLRGKNHDSIVYKELYDGEVWCPTCEGGLFMARRNGIPFFTGNSWPNIDINNAQSYPIMIINSPDLIIDNLTYEKKKAHATVRIEIFSTNQKQLDELAEDVIYSIESIDHSLKPANITFIKLTDTSSDHMMRDKITVHSKVLQYECDYSYGAGE
jgi:hypothetical protein